MMYDVSYQNSAFICVVFECCIYSINDPRVLVSLILNT